MSETIVPAAPPALRHVRAFPLHDVEVRESGNGTDYTIRGHAAVFNAMSDDLGGFREIIHPGHFARVLRGKPDVRLLINHDSNRVMARTASGTLDLREDERGLHVWARVAPTTYASDLRMTMQRGDIDQMSFAWDWADDGDDWKIGDDGGAIHHCLPDGARELFDVSVVTFPAYTQTDAAMRSSLDRAVSRGHLPEEIAGAISDLARLTVGAEESTSRSDADDGESKPVNARLLAARAKGRVAISQTPTPK